MKRYNLIAARIEGPDSPPIIAVQIPWEQFCHPLGPDEYARIITKARYMPVIVSRGPNGEWCSAAFCAHHWNQIVSTISADKLGWHTMPVTNDESPEEELGKWFATGIH